MNRPVAFLYGVANVPVEAWVDGEAALAAVPPARPTTPAPLTDPDLGAFANENVRVAVHFAGETEPVLVAFGALLFTTTATTSVFAGVLGGQIAGALRARFDLWGTRRAAGACGRYVRDLARQLDELEARQLRLLRIADDGDAAYREAGVEFVASSASYAD